MSLRFAHVSTQHPVCVFKAKDQVTWQRTLVPFAICLPAVASIAGGAEAFPHSFLRPVAVVHLEEAEQANAEEEEKAQEQDTLHETLQKYFPTNER